MKSKLSYNYLVHRIERLDHSIIEIKEAMKKIMSDAKVEWIEQRKFRKKKKQREFLSSKIGFINLHTENPMKHFYIDTPRRRSNIVSSFL